MEKYIKHHLMPDTYLGKSSDLHFKKLSEFVGVEISNIDISTPITNNQVKDILSAFAVHSLLVFRNQNLSSENIVQFSKLFGKLLPHIVDEFNHENVIVLSNMIDKKGNNLGADRSGMQWHSDGSFREKPNMGSLLYGVNCPDIGANTEFSSTYAAFDSLDKIKKEQLSILLGIHDYSWYWTKYQSSRPPLTIQEKQQTPPVTHPILRTHPVTGWNTTYVSECVTSGIEGMDENIGRKLVMEISDFSTQNKFRYSHKWLKGDLLFWDNRSVIHRATEFDNKYDRLMLRTSVRGQKPYFSGL